MTLKLGSIDGFRCGFMGKRILVGNRKQHGTTTVEEARVMLNGGTGRQAIYSCGTETILQTTSSGWGHT
jgi:hypothetical protein